jgi:hypothetical protein
MAGELATALDPVILWQRAGIEPDPWQADVLRSAAPRLLLNCARQTGKSATVATLADHTALYRPDSLILLLSPGERQSKELFKKCAGVYRTLGRPVPAETENKLELELVNGSRLVALPGNEGTIRGFSGAVLLIVDEAARVPDDLYRTVRPMLAVSGGRLVALSTPFGTRGWWWDAWAHGGDTWQRVEVPATACPRISAAFLAEERRALGEWWFNQEYLCMFMDAESAAFRRADIDRAFSEDVEQWSI